MAETIEIDETEEMISNRTILYFPVEAFQLFCKEHSIDERSRKHHLRNPSFILPTFTKLEESYGKTHLSLFGSNDYGTAA